MPKPSTAPAAAPWDDVSPGEQLVVLITGANSGIGLGIGERLIDEFLATRSLTSHLILLPTTRSQTKCRETVQALREYAVRAAQNSPALASRYASAAKTTNGHNGNGNVNGHSNGNTNGAANGRANSAVAVAGGEFRWQDAVARIHVLSLVLDLCDLRGVRSLADRLCNGTVSNPPGLDDEYLVDVRIPKLDSVIFNAAYGGWSGFNLFSAIWSILSKGLTQTVTWPTFKQALPTRILNEQPSYNYPEQPLLGEVFCACIFGHYFLAHNLLPLLSRRSASTEEPGRIIWSSSIEAVRDAFNIDDIQCFQRPAPYESVKRLTDIMSITSSLPSVRPYSQPFFQIDSYSASATSSLSGDKTPTSEDLPVQPKMYLTHPGVVASSLFPVPWFLFWAYRLSLIVCRLIGSPWHVVYSYPGAKSAAWVAIQPQDALDDVNADRCKLGSSTSPSATDVRVKKTEVEGWGWEGVPEDSRALKDDEGVDGVFRKAVGRKKGVVDATPEHIAEFEELGVQCWKQMETLRYQWEKILDAEE